MLASPAEVEVEGSEVAEGGEAGTGPAAKKYRSSESHATCEMGCGKENVESNEAGVVEMSQICGAKKMGAR